MGIWDLWGLWGCSEGFHSATGVDGVFGGFPSLLFLALEAERGTGGDNGPVRSSLKTAFGPEGRI